MVEVPANFSRKNYFFKVAPFTYEVREGIWQVSDVTPPHSLFPHDLFTHTLSYSLEDAARCRDVITGRYFQLISS